MSLGDTIFTPEDNDTIFALGGTFSIFPNTFSGLTSVAYRKSRGLSGSSTSLTDLEQTGIEADIKLALENLRKLLLTKDGKPHSEDAWEDAHQYRSGTTALVFAFDEQNALFSASRRTYHWPTYKNAPAIRGEEKLYTDYDYQHDTDLLNLQVSQAFPLSVSSLQGGNCFVPLGPYIARRPADGVEITLENFQALWKTMKISVLKRPNGEVMGWIVELIRGKVAGRNAYFSI